jgi:hypothetical protein
VKADVLIEGLMQDVKSLCVLVYAADTDEAERDWVDVAAIEHPADGHPAERHKS